MLLLHQTGIVKIGEVVRYTVTYTPAHDRILPSPQHLYLKVRNTSAIALRAAFVHGPYTLYVSSAPATFHPNKKFETPRRDGIPEFEPNLKAGGTWYSQLTVPEEVRKTAGNAHADDDGLEKSVSWIIEIASQVIFSNSASVHYEILLGRDEKSLSLGIMSSSSPAGIPGQVSDHQQSQGAKDGHHAAQPKGVFTRAMKLKVEDTASLWNTPRLPEWDEQGKEAANAKNADAPTESATNKPAPQDSHNGRKQKKIHLVVLTHGLHSNLGADMLFMKESIDEAVKQAKIDARKRRNLGSSAPQDGLKQTSKEKETSNEDEDEDEDEVLVRGFSGNAVRTEKGIKYLGKRLAKYVLAMAYPDQPYRPIARTATQSLAAAIKHDKHDKDHQGHPIHQNSTKKEAYTERKAAYQITSISFIAHSLGGLIQTYAIAYIQKHSPHFFDTIKPINFIAMATPFLGLSNENPLYVKFALDFGLVGRTGQDLGLTWRAPTIARGGWGALVGNIGESAHKKVGGEQDPGAKPLLRILPTGPAHVALKKFRNRTVYSNVVNDGIVPLRTSCLLFLDWSGLGRVEKARRENGLVGTMAGWGWAELTGANSSAASKRSWVDSSQDTEDETESNTPTREGKGIEVPQPAENATEDDARSLKSTKVRSRGNSFLGDEDNVLHPNIPITPTSATAHNAGAFDSIWSLFKSHPAPKTQTQTPKHVKIYKRSQTIKIEEPGSYVKTNGSPQATSGDKVTEQDNLSAPPKTTFFEAAGDILSPPMPPVEFLINPADRPRTIFHDRVYHPEDIPLPPLKRKSTAKLVRRSSSTTTAHTSSSSKLSSGSEDDPLQVVDGSAMKVEEKIARAYHRDLSWRKVLVRLEPDAHNNMIVRRKFANAYGWPVVKHLVDTHFSDSVAAMTADDDESSGERAKESNKAPDNSGSEVNKEGDEEDEDCIPPLSQLDRTNSEVRESQDEVPALNSMRPGNLAKVLNSTNSINFRPRYPERQDSAQWSDGDFMDSDGDSEPESSNETTSPKKPQQQPAASAGWNWTEAIVGKGASSPRGGTKKEDIDAFLETKVRHSNGAGESKTTTPKDKGFGEDMANTRSTREADGTVGLGHRRLESGSSTTSQGVVETVAKLSLGLEDK